MHVYSILYGISIPLDMRYPCDKLCAMCVHRCWKVCLHTVHVNFHANDDVCFIFDLVCRNCVHGHNSRVVVAALFFSFVCIRCLKSDPPGL